MKFKMDWCLEDIEGYEYKTLYFDLYKGDHVRKVELILYHNGMVDWRGDDLTDEESAELIMWANRKFPHENLE